MKYILTLIFISLLSFSSHMAKAQTYFVYDGEQFSVMFVCNEGSEEITEETLLEIDYTAQNSNGEKQWYKFEMKEFQDIINDEFLPGFYSYCSDINNRNFVLDYSSETDELEVTPLDENGSRSTISWILKRRVE